MKCPKCQFNNRQEAKFCNECGSKLELSCPECNKANPSGSKFCDECGYNLTSLFEQPTKELSFDEKIKKIQRYLPQGLTEKILSQKNKIEGERKQVTVMFCDMAGYTSLSEILGPEEAYSIMDQVYEILIHKVHEFEGTVNEMTGDGVLALFGAPIAIEDAPQRSIRVAMAIHQEISKLNDRLKKDHAGLLVLKMRIGIHTGPVVVGTLGNDLRVEFKAVGDTVNLASRMENMAEPGATNVTETTFKLTEGLFRFEALGEKTVKGKKEPVKVYRVIAISSRRTRFDVSAERGLTPFVSRERELELLLDGFERAKAGRGQAFSIMAEAGVGKSRLLYEFRKAVSNEDVTFLEGKCLSYSRGVPYHPVIDVLKSNFNILDSDDCLKIRQKVEQWLETIGINDASILPYLLELLSVKDSGIDKILMSPEARKDRIMSAVRQITLKGSEIRPLVIAIEDLHWIDRSSEEYQKTLLESISGARVFLIFTYRPEYVHTWGGKSYHSQVTLNRLSNRESLAMVSHLLGTDDIDRQIEELVLEKAEGIPFFIEEFVKSLKDLKIIETKKKKYCLVKDIKDVVIPSTIQEVIMARVDLLPEGAKELLQIGSVIEREFSHKLITQVTGFPEQELLSRLSALKDSELIYERGIYPESTYIFKHAISSEIVYDSILSKKKKRLHAKIGNVIEELYKGNIDEQYEVLSDHFIKSENYQKGAEYSKMAGRAARKKSAFKDAVSHTKKRVYCLEKLPQTDAVQKKRIDARTTLSNYYLNLNFHVEAMEAVTPIVDLALKMGYQKSLPQIFTASGTYHTYIEEDFPKGIEELKKVIEISKKTGDLFSLWLAYYYLGIGLSYECEFENGLKYFTKALDLSIAAKNEIGISVVKSALASLNYAFQGKIDLAFEMSKETLNLAEESNDIFIKGTSLTFDGWVYYYKGLFDEAESYLLEGADLSEKASQIGWGSWSALYLGIIYCERGDYEKARSFFDKGILILKNGKIIPSFIRFFKICVAKTKTLKNDADINLKSLYNYARENKIKSFDGWISRLISEILMNLDGQNLSEAEDWIKKAIETDEKRGLRWQLAMDHAIYSDYFIKKGDFAKAKENLARAIEIFKECGADGWVAKYEKELAVM